MANVATFRQLCVVATEQAQANPALLGDSVEWKETIKDRAIALGFSRPSSIDVSRAMDQVEHAERRRSPPPPSRPTPAPLFEEPSDPTVMARPWRKPGEAAMFTRPIEPSTSSGCGCSKPVLGAPPLTCNLDAGHDGRHGVRLGSHIAPFVTWEREP